jgi:hypothetical protein
VSVAKVVLAVLSLAVSMAPPAYTQGQSGPGITVEEPWARATPGGAKTGAAYMTLINKGGAADRLLGAVTPVAREVQFHKVTEENGISRMRELRSIDIAPGGKVLLKPGNIHVMLVDLKQPLKQGETFPLTLEFEKAGRIDLTVPIARVGATQPHSGMHH